MSRDTSMANKERKQDTSWIELIEYSQTEINACEERIKKLRKSLIFFKNQAKEGVPFPVSESTRHPKTS